MNYALGDGELTRVWRLPQPLLSKSRFADRSRDLIVGEAKWKWVWPMFKWILTLCPETEMIPPMKVTIHIFCFFDSRSLNDLVPRGLNQVSSPPFLSCPCLMKRNLPLNWGPNTLSYYFINVFQITYAITLQLAIEFLV